MVELDKTVYVTRSGQYRFKFMYCVSAYDRHIWLVTGSFGTMTRTDIKRLNHNFFSTRRYVKIVSQREWAAKVAAYTPERSIYGG